MADESKVLETVRRYFEFVGADVERAEEIYHDDAILEFPQSGERFEGVATFTEWRRHYPADPAQMRFRIRRVTARLDLAVVELTATYDGTSWLQAVQLLEFRGDKVARADLCHGRLGGSRVAGALALGHTGRPARGNQPDLIAVSAPPCKRFAVVSHHNRQNEQVAGPRGWSAVPTISGTKSPARDQQRRRGRRRGSFAARAGQVIQSVIESRSRS